MVAILLEIVCCCCYWMLLLLLLLYFVFETTIFGFNCVFGLEPAAAPTLLLARQEVLFVASICSVALCASSVDLMTVNHTNLWRINFLQYSVLINGAVISSRETLRRCIGRGVARLRISTHACQPNSMVAIIIYSRIFESITDNCLHCFANVDLIEKHTTRQFRTLSWLAMRKLHSNYVWLRLSH